MLGGSISLLVAARLAIRSEKPGAKQCDQYAGEQAGDKAEPEVMPNIHPKQFTVLGNRIEGGLGQGCTIRARADNFSVCQHQNGFQIPFRRLHAELIFWHRMGMHPS